MEISSIAILIIIAVSLGVGTLTGAVWTFYKMCNDGIKTKKELDLKTKLLQKIKKEHKENYYFNEHNMVEFAKFNTKHHKGRKTVYDKLNLYKLQTYGK